LRFAFLSYWYFLTGVPVAILHVESRELRLLFGTPPLKELSLTLKREEELKGFFFNKRTLRPNHLQANHICSDSPFKFG
jgi:hypothetical protein